MEQIYHGMYIYKLITFYVNLHGILYTGTNTQICMGPNAITTLDSCIWIKSHYLINPSCMNLKCCDRILILKLSRHLDRKHILYAPILQPCKASRVLKQENVWGIIIIHITLVLTFYMSNVTASIQFENH